MCVKCHNKNWLEPVDIITQSLYHVFITMSQASATWNYSTKSCMKACYTKVLISLIVLHVVLLYCMAWCHNKNWIDPLDIITQSLHRVHTGKYFRNLIKSTWNQFVSTIFRLIWIQSDVRLNPNQSWNGKYNLISGWLNKILEMFLCIIQMLTVTWNWFYRLFHAHCVARKCIAG